MPTFGKIRVTGPANRNVYFKGIYDSNATRLDSQGKSKTEVTAELGEHTLVTIRDKVSFRIDYEGTGEIRRDGECIKIKLEHVGSGGSRRHVQ